MSLLTTDYNSGSNSDDNNSDDGDFEERDSLKLANYAIIEFEITRLGEYAGNQYGQSLIADFDNVQVHHGMAYDRFYSEDDDTVKVFGFGEWFKTNPDGTLAEEIDPDFINKRISESFGGNSYPYEYMGHATEDEDEHIDLGNMTMWLNNNTKNRTFAKVVTPDGHDVIGDKESDQEWLATENPEIRDDLKGRRLLMFYKKESFIPDGDDEEITYTDAVILDAETGAGITIQNGSSSSSGSTDADDADDGPSGSVGGDDGGLPEGVPEDLDQIIDFMARTDQTEAENVERLADGETDADYDLDAVVSEVKSRRGE